MAETVFLEPGGIEITLRHAPRARRISLRVSRLDGKVTLSLPKGAPRKAALEFAAERRDWIEAARKQAPEAVEVGPGVILPVEGGDVTVRVGAGRRARLSSGRLDVPERAPGPAARGLLRELARDRLAAASDRYARALGRDYARLTLRDTRSRWGSCSAQGHLMYSWRLILAPPDVLAYVAAHEVAHLRHMDHSPAFWGLVSQLCPEWRDHRQWLRINGADLHRYRFGD